LGEAGESALGVVAAVDRQESGDLGLDDPAQVIQGGGAGPAGRRGGGELFGGMRELAGFGHAGSRCTASGLRWLA
jgi:hypothetical protein